MISSPSAGFKFTITERLFRFVAWEYADSGGRCADAAGCPGASGALSGLQDSLRTKGREVARTAVIPNRLALPWIQKHSGHTSNGLVAKMA